MTAALDIFEKNIIDCKQGSVRAVRYNVDGNYIITCGSDKKLKLWNPKSGLLLKTYGGHAHEVTDACGSCESSHIASASLDKSIIYWDVTTGQPLKRLRGHAGGVTCVKFNEDSSVIVSGSKDNTVMCWDIRTRNLDPMQTMRDAKDSISSLIVTDSKIITASLDGSIRYYDIRIGEMTNDTLGVPVTFVSQMKYIPCVVAACSDSAVRLIDMSNGDILQEFKGHRTDDCHIECSVVSNDSKVISGTADGYAIVWDLLNGNETQRLKIGRGSVINSLVTHPTGTEILFTNKEKVHLWGGLNN